MALCTAGSILVGGIIGILWYLDRPKNAAKLDLAGKLMRIYDVESNVDANSGQQGYRLVRAEVSDGRYLTIKIPNLHGSEIPDWSINPKNYLARISNPLNAEQVSADPWSSSIFLTDHKEKVVFARKEDAGPACFANDIPLNRRLALVKKADGTPWYRALSGQRLGGALGVRYWSWIDLILCVEAPGVSSVQTSSSRHPSSVPSSPMITATTSSGLEEAVAGMPLRILLDVDRYNNDILPSLSTLSSVTIRNAQFSPDCSEIVVDDALNGILFHYQSKDSKDYQSMSSNASSTEPIDPTTPATASRGSSVIKPPTLLSKSSTHGTQPSTSSTRAASISQQPVSPTGTTSIPPLPVSTESACPIKKTTYGSFLFYNVPHQDELIACIERPMNYLDGGKEKVLDEHLSWLKSTPHSRGTLIADMELEFQMCRIAYDSLADAISSDDANEYIKKIRELYQSGIVTSDQFLKIDYVASVQNFQNNHPQKFIGVVPPRFAEGMFRLSKLRPEEELAHVAPIDDVTRSFLNAYLGVGFERAGTILSYCTPYYSGNQFHGIKLITGKLPLIKTGGGWFGCPYGYYSHDFFDIEVFSDKRGRAIPVIIRNTIPAPSGPKSKSEGKGNQ